MMSDESLLGMWQELVGDGDDNDDRRLAFFHMLRKSALLEAAKLCGKIAEERRRQRDCTPRLTVGEQQVGIILEAKRSEAARCEDAILRLEEE